MREVSVSGAGHVTPLMLSADNGHDKAVRLLLASGASQAHGSESLLLSGRFRLKSQRKPRPFGVQRLRCAALLREPFYITLPHRRLAMYRSIVLVLAVSAAGLETLSISPRDSFTTTCL